MKVKIYGDDSDWKPNLIPRIIEGFKDNEWEIVTNPSQADLLYCNDPCGYNSFVDDAKILDTPNIVNILDIPTFSPDCNDILKRYEKVCNSATAVTTISQFVHSQVKSFYNIDSTVIYQPSKPINQIEDNAEFNTPRRFLFVGRANSANKRFFLIKQLMEEFYSEKQILTIGSEDPNYGKYMGTLSDEWLNIIYGMSDYILFPSVFEGLGLPPIEAVLAGKFPIVCEDCQTSMEFLPEFAAPPTAEGIYYKIQDIEENRETYLKIIKKYQDLYSNLLSPKTVVGKIVNLYNKINNK